MSQEQEYIQNRNRVFEIYGINPNDKRYNCHHIVQKCDLGVIVSSTFRVNEISNLYPILITDHNEVNRRIALDDICEKEKHFSKHPKKKKHKK